MLKPQYRLRRRKAFGRVYRRGNTWATPAVSLVWVRTRPASELKVGFSVSKKLGNSVKRNRIKRLMRENVRLVLPRMQTGYHLVFVARKGAADADYHKLGADMRYLMYRAQLLKKEEPNK